MSSKRNLVALKYCGGCDPAYERAEYFELIKEAAGERIAWVRLEDGGWEAVLLICGCATACPEGDMPAGARVLRLSDNRTPPEDIVAKLLKRE